MKFHKLKTTTYVLFILVLFSSCKSIQFSQNNKKIEKKATKTNGNNFQSYTTLSYIEEFKDIAIYEMNLNGIPASITLAQGILESGNGNSELAKYANNHFGIKCTSDWKGKNYYKDDDSKDECFRVYTNARDSYKDHSEFLKRKRYSALFQYDKNDYKSWAVGLKNAGYATNPKYPELLISLIERYELYQYDQPESEKQKLAREDRIFTQINNNIPNENKKFTPVYQAPNTNNIANNEQHIVVKGDTLYNISKRFNLTVDQLKSLNNMVDNNVKIGQILKVK